MLSPGFIRSLVFTSTDVSMTSFEDFWQKYQSNLPGYADSGAIQEIVREIAYAAWQEASAVTSRRI